MRDSTAGVGVVARQERQIGGALQGMAKLGRMLGLAALTLGLGACALLTPEPALTTYDLSARTSARNLGATEAQLTVREPRAVQALDSDRIVFRPSPLLVTYYADAQWTDRLPRLIEARLVQAFEASGSLKTVARATDGLTTDYQLMTEVRDFSVAQTDQGPLAHVAIYVKIIADSKGKVVTGRLFEAELGAQGQDAASGVAALDGALTKVMTNLVRWTLGQI